MSAKQATKKQYEDKVRGAAEKAVPFKDVVQKHQVTKEIEKDLLDIYNTSAAYKKTIDIIRNQDKDAMSFINNYNDVKITSGPNQGKECKIVFSDPAIPNRVEVFLPNENRYTYVAPKNMEFKKSTEDIYQKGETFFERQNRENYDSYENLESFEVNNMQVNKNIERAAFNLANASARTETPRNKREVVEKIDEILYEKKEKDFENVIREIESSFPELNAREKQDVKNSIKRFLKSNENLVEIPVYNVDFILFSNFDIRLDFKESSLETVRLLLSLILRILFLRSKLSFIFNVH